MSDEAREAVQSAARAIRERERADNLMRFAGYAAAIDALAEEGNRG